MKFTLVQLLRFLLLERHLYRLLYITLELDILHLPGLNNFMNLLLGLANHVNL